MLPLTITKTRTERLMPRFIVRYEQANPVEQKVTPRCGARECVPMNIDPDQFLSDPHAQTCWDCPLVSRKIGMMS